MHFRPFRLNKMHFVGISVDLRIRLYETLVFLTARIKQNFDNNLLIPKNVVEPMAILITLVSKKITYTKNRWNLQNLEFRSKMVITVKR